MIEAVGVVIPAHNEVELLGECLQSVDGALASLPRSIECSVAVVVDASTDDSEAVARAWAIQQASKRTRQQVLAVDFQNVGCARAAGMTELLRSLDNKIPRSRIWLATSDADSTVPATWLTAQLELAASGFEAIAGSISVDDWSHYDEHDREELVARFREFYEAAAAHAEPHVHGANLGIRADAYALVGGFAPLATGEDHALWNALRHAERPRIAARAITVTTSARKVARAPAGFSGFLAALLRDPRSCNP